MGAAAEGPIPWTAIDAYAARFGWAEDPDAYAEFLFLIETMDGAYLARSAEKARTKAEPRKPTSRKRR